jgi:uncharacterized protein YcfJ
MNKSMLVGTILGVAVATAGGVFAGYKMLQSDEAEGQTVALSAGPLAEPVVDCPPGMEPRDKHRIAGTAIGAIVGGAVGNDVGDSDVTTAAGAAAGAFAGHEIQKRLQEQKQADAATAAGCQPSNQ